MVQLFKLLKKGKLALTTKLVGPDHVQQKSQNFHLIPL